MTGASDERVLASREAKYIFNVTEIRAFSTLYVVEARDLAAAVKAAERGDPAVEVARSVPGDVLRRCVDRVPVSVVDIECCTDSRVVRVLAADLRPGDLVDLQGDDYADPGRDRAEFVFEYARVASVERETPSCVAVGVENIDVFGFPPDHTVRLVLPESAGGGESERD